MSFGRLIAVDEAEKVENERATISNKGPNKRLVDSEVTSFDIPQRFTYSGNKYGNAARKYRSKTLGLDEAEENGSENTANSNNDKGPNNKKWSDPCQSSVGGVATSANVRRPKLKSWIGKGVIHSPTNHLERSDEQNTVIVELKAAQTTANPEIKGTPTKVQQGVKTVTLRDTNRTFYQYKMEKVDKMPGNLKFTKTPRTDFYNSKPYTGHRSFLSFSGQKSKKRFQTPVCLTISSDEEDESSTRVMHTSLPAGFHLLQTEECGQEKEANNSPMKQLGPVPCVSSVEDPDQQIIKQTAALKCRSVRIGTLKVSQCLVVFTKDAMTITGESPNNIDVRLPMMEIKKVLYNFGNLMPIVIIYTSVECGEEVRRNLDMKRIGHHYDPASSKESERRIILLPYCPSEVTKVAFKAVFRCAQRERVQSSSYILNEIDDKCANKLLVLSTPREVFDGQDTQVKVRKLLRSKSNTEAKQKEHIETRICVFPLETGGIQIAANDIACLEKGEFLNDIIIDFYLKYLFLNQLSESDRQRTHIFSSFFYKRLTTQPKMKYASNVENLNLPAAERRHNRVKNWTRTVDIFQKDFIIIPMNENFHWFLTIICFPSLVMPNEQLPSTSLLEKNKPEIEEKPLETVEPMDEMDMDITHDDCHTSVVQRPCIIVFDSLGGDCYRKNTAMLREYLTVEWKTRKNSERGFSKNTMPGVYPKIPLQNNSSDCGIYLLQYVESFFMKPITDYSFPIESLLDWFDVQVVNQKRDVIKEIILDLSRQQKEQNERNSPKES